MCQTLWNVFLQPWQLPLWAPDLHMQLPPQTHLNVCRTLQTQKKKKQIKARKTKLKINTLALNLLFIWYPVFQKMAHPPCFIQSGNVKITFNSSFTLMLSFHTCVIKPYCSYLPNVPWFCSHLPLFSFAWISRLFSFYTLLAVLYIVFRKSFQSIEWVEFFFFFLKHSSGFLSH